MQHLFANNTEQLIERVIIPIPSGHEDRQNARLYEKMAEKNNLKKLKTTSISR